MVTRTQLVQLGFSDKAIRHRLKSGGLHPLWRGVYAVARPEVTRLGMWMAAVLLCGRRAALSHGSAGALWGFGVERAGLIEVSVPIGVTRRRSGITVHRRSALCADDLTRHRGIPITTPACTIVDLAPRLGRGPLERVINEADKLDLIDPEALRSELERMGGRAGAPTVRGILDRRTFTLTDSELERRFLPLARRAGLPPPQTQRRVNGFRVDFYWPELGLVVETDGLRYHRTPAQQVADRRRDRTHTAAGLTQLRFTHGDVRYEPSQVCETLAAVGKRLGGGEPQR